MGRGNNMAAKTAVSTKRILIDKANLTIVIATSVAVFIAVFSLVGIRAIWNQRNYQAAVISKKEAAKKQLQANIEAVDSLVESYKQFVSGTANVIGGSTTGTGDRDGDNAKIVLDALPSKYDFPALASSLEKLIIDNGNQITAITGTDDEINQQTADASAGQQAVKIPFEATVAGNYESIQRLISVLEKSIRPFPINTITITGQDSQINMTIDASTYYQPEKSLSIRSEEV